MITQFYFETRRKVLLIAPVIVTLILWLWAKLALESDFFNASKIPEYLGETLGLLSIVYFALDFVIAARYRFLESIFGGLDKTYILHRQLGEYGFAMMFFHPVALLFASPVGLSEGFFDLFIPFYAQSTAKLMGITAWYLFIALVLLTIVKILPYNYWKQLHKFMGVAFIFGVAHGFMAVSDLAVFLPLQLWIGAFAATGIYSYFYKLLLYNKFGPKYEYEVISNKSLGNDVYELILDPKGRRINFEPGKFVFLSIHDSNIVSKEEHPFSISSCNSKNQIRISYKTVGDYTRNLTKVKKGAKAMLYGPYGEFTSFVFNPFEKQVWVAGGIGVTPFLSMLAYESKNEHSKNIYFINANQNENNNVYGKEIESYLGNTDDNLRYWNYLSDNEGRLDGEKIKKFVNGHNLKKAVFLFCGPPKMMKALKKQLIALGVAPKKIVFEDFGFY